VGSTKTIPCRELDDNKNIGSSTIDVDKTRCDKVCRLFIDNYSDADFWSVLDALSSNHVVEKVVIFRRKKLQPQQREVGEKECGRQPQEQQRQQQELGEEESRQQLQEQQQPHRRPSDDIDYLFHVLRSLSSLTELNLWNFSDDDLDSLSLGLVDHPSIVYVQLHMDSGTLNETVGKAIATMRRLVSLEVEVGASFPLWPIASSQSLSVFSVVSSRFKWESRHIMPFAERLERNCGVLTVLDLEPEMSCECLCALLSSIRTATTMTTTSRNDRSSRLDTLQFNCQTLDVNAGDACIIELSKLIDANKDLRVVWNHRYESFCTSEHIESTILKSIESSPSIEQFHVFVENDDFCHAKCMLLEAKIGDEEAS
jgi:hypothetical protein